MQTAVRRKKKPKHHHRNEIKHLRDDLLLSEYASKMMNIVAANTYAGVQSLKVDLKSSHITLTGFCESYYVKQLAQQAIMDMVIDMEIVNEIVVI